MILACLLCNISIFVANVDSSSFCFQLEHNKYANLNEQLAEATLQLRFPKLA
jgi:hypothetical protein